jgi:hypothetical protein
VILGALIHDSLHRSRIAILALGICLAFGERSGAAQSPDRKCPVVIQQVELSYSHQGGPSVPRLTIRFNNDSGKRIAKVAFNLALLDSGGYPHEYPDDLEFGGGLEAGMRRTHAWNLKAESVDIHRAGEIVTVQRISFDDTTTWADDGTESCKFTVDFHAR